MIVTRNTNTAPYKVYPFIIREGVQTETRNGPAVSVPYPVTICYKRPDENVNFCPVRDANPFFHFMEMLWFLEAEGDVAFISRYLPNMANFSDDGEKFNAHYGFNVRWQFGRDQLRYAIHALREDPNSRRVVVQIWNPDDLGKPSKDLACNTQLLFRIMGGKLNMTVYNRSNDAVWGGVTGANITNLYIFQAYVAAALDIPVGLQYVVSNDLHLYTELDPKVHDLIAKYTSDCIAPAPGYDDPKTSIPLGDEHFIRPWQLLQPGENVGHLDHDIIVFLKRLRDNDYRPPHDIPFVTLLRTTAVPLAEAHWQYKHGNMAAALTAAALIQSTDWKFACLNWLKRRVK